MAISKDLGPSDRILSDTLDTLGDAMSLAVRSKWTSGCSLAIVTAILEPNEPFAPVIMTVPVNGVAITKALKREKNCTCELRFDLGKEGLCEVMRDENFWLFFFRKDELVVPGL